MAEAFARGQACYRAGAFAESAAIFAELCRARPGDPDAIRLLGLSQLRLGERADALALLAKARALAPDDAYAQLHYGLGLHAVGRHAEAAAQFRACTQLLPDDPAPFLNLSAALLALGEHDRALDAARRARRRAPNMVQAVYMVGLALLALDRLDDAEEKFAAAVRLAPEFADAWVNLGIVRYRRDDIERAKVAMRRALVAAPGHAAAAANLAVFLRLTGAPEESEDLLRGVLSCHPAAAEARLNLAAALLQEERASEALALLDEQPVPAEPRLARHWQMQRSLALLQLGRVEEARAALAKIGEAPPELAPLSSWRRILLALAEGKPAEARKHAGVMERALAAAPGLVPEHRIMGHFDLAKFWSQQGEPDRAFPHWTEGHRLIGRFQPFSRQARRNFVDATIARFDRARLADGPRARNRDPAPVFIVGMPRSGTTLAEQIIASHPQAFGAGERAALGRAFAELGGSDTSDAVGRIAALEEASFDAAAERYLAELRALAPGAARIIDKMPGNFDYLGLIALMLPGARIIYCTRDPRDIGLSIFTYRFFGHHPYAHDLGDLGWYIAEHQRLMAHWRAVLPNPLLTVELADWVNDLTGTLRRVLEFLDLPYDAACERFYERDSRVLTVSRKQVREPVNARGLGRWRRYKRELRPLIAELDAHSVQTTSHQHSAPSRASIGSPSVNHEGGVS
ncbi:MAG: sulfotransferase [Methylobacteriaceae bacterium]|nr:sulfotransferase [Methylobacteriaceae bacterium]